MRTRTPASIRSSRPKAARLARARGGSALIVVLWVCLGLVSVALYFAQSMRYEIRAADNRLAAVQAEQAISGAVRYASNVLSNLEIPGLLPDVYSYENEAVAVGEATFWFIGRSDEQMSLDETTFGFVDECSKLNLNTATVEMLALLPRMTPELAAAIVDWRDADSDVSEYGGAEDETYQQLNTPYRCKNAPFESVDELRLVYGMDMEMLYGDDANLNGALDPNENDGDETGPYDDRNGILDPGLLEYVTVWSRESTSTRTNVNDQEGLLLLLQEAFGNSRADQIVAQLNSAAGGGAGGGGAGGGGAGGGGQGGGTTNQTTFTNLVQFYLSSLMTQEEFDTVASLLVATTNTTGYADGLVNINTAPEAVLACIPGIETQYASTLVASRLGNNSALSIAWLVDLIGSDAALLAGSYITTSSYQYSVDVAAVGRYGRGYHRNRYVMDTSDGTARVAHRQDLTDLGWALGRTVREDLKLLTNTK